MLNLMDTSITWGTDMFDSVQRCCSRGWLVRAFVVLSVVIILIGAFIQLTFWSDYRRTQAIARDVSALGGDVDTYFVGWGWLPEWPMFQRIGGVIFMGKKLDTAWLRHLKDLKTLRGLVLIEVSDSEGRGLSDELLQSLDLPNLMGLTLLQDPAVDGSFLEEFPKLQSLALANCTRIGDDAMQKIGRLKRMQGLRLDGTAITSDGVKHLAKLRDLEELDMSRTRIDDSAMPYLRDLTQLRRLELTDTSIGDAGLKYFAALSNLEYLYLKNTRVRGSGLNYLSGLRKLKALSLKNCPVDDNGLTYLISLSRLRLLDLSGTNVTDAGLEDLGKISALTNLELTETKVTGAGIVHLTALANLVDLHLDGSDVADENLKALATARPQHRAADCRPPSINVQTTKVTRVGVELLKKAFPGAYVIYDEHE